MKNRSFILILRRNIAGERNFKAKGEKGMNVVAEDTTMYNFVEEGTAIYKVATNREGQFSIWPVDQEIPVIWEEVVKKGRRQECLDYIIGIWAERKKKEAENQALAEKMAEEAKRKAFEEKRRIQMKMSL